MLSFVHVTTVLHTIQCVCVQCPLHSVLYWLLLSLLPRPLWLPKASRLSALCVTEVTAAFSCRYCSVAHGQPQQCLATYLVLFSKKASNVRPSVSGIEHLCDLSL